MRTPKINNLYILIDWLNEKFKGINIEKHKWYKYKLSANSWLADFIDADGLFFVNNSKKSNTCVFELVKSSVYKHINKVLIKLE